MVKSNTDNILPEWMKEEQDYTPLKGSDGFVTATVLRFLKLFRHFHTNREGTVTYMGAGMRLLLCLGLILTVAMASNMFYLACVAAAFLVYLSISKTEVIKRVISASLVTAFLTFLIMLPAFFLYAGNSFIVLPIKVFLSVGMLTLFTNVTPWNKITGSLRIFFVPNLVIFILDITIHYILLLGNIAYEMLEALKLRSVGKNKDRKQSFSGILGTVFLKSVEMSHETRDAMTCRMFDGTYTRTKETFVKTDLIPAFILILYIVIFVYLN